MHIKVLPLLLIFLLSHTSCKKNDTGGEAYITPYVYHHGTPVNHPTFYIKYGAKKAPSDPTNDYDEKIQGKHENHAHLKYLRYGYYYVYATGIDSTLMVAVAGGAAVHIKWKERRKETVVNIEAGE
jgi:hypothetical protein